MAFISTVDRMNFFEKSNLRCNGHWMNTWRRSGSSSRHPVRAFLVLREPAVLRTCGVDEVEKMSWLLAYAWTHKIKEGERVRDSEFQPKTYMLR